MLYVGVPLLAVARTPVALQLLQAFASALVAPAVYRIAARSLPQRTALVLAWVAVAYPSLAAVTFVDFHENGFVAPLVLWLAWSVLARRFALASVLAGALLCVKEDEALILAFAGMVTALVAARAGDRRLAVLSAGTALAACGVAAGYFLWLQPLAAGGRAWDPLRFYAGAAGHGDALTVSYASPARLGYVLEALYPLLFTPLLSKRFVYVLPGLAEDVLSRHSLPFSMNSHYPAVWVPWMLFAAVDGCAVARRLGGRRTAGTATALLVACCAVLTLSSPTHWRRYLSWPGAHDARLQATLDALPREADIGTQDEIFSHLGFDPNARVGLARRPHVVVIDATREADSYYVPMLRRAVAPGRGYALVRGIDGIAVYRRPSLRMPS